MPLEAIIFLSIGGLALTCLSVFAALVFKPDLCDSLA
jgi:hypothetical protein